MTTKFYHLRHRTLLAGFCTFFLVFCFSCNQNSHPGSSEKSGWKLVWQDEFNYTGLPDPTKWDYETGHIANNEQQYYTRARKENIWVANGVLTITGRKEEYPNARYSPGSSHWTTKNPTAPYTSARLVTYGKAAWTYGRVEIKAKLPQGRGIWPALWMLGTNIKTDGWPACGEIDIMEFIGDKEPDAIYGTVHYKNDEGKHASGGSKINSDKLAGNFHTYAMEWNKDSISMFFNDVKYNSFALDSAGKNKDIFAKPFYLLINLALGGDWPGPVDAAILPRQFIVDYVRVYQKQ